MEVKQLGLFPGEPGSVQKKRKVTRTVGNTAPYPKAYCEKHLRFCSSFWDMSFWADHKNEEETTRIVALAAECDKDGRQKYPCPVNFCTNCWYHIGILYFWHNCKLPELVGMVMANPHKKENSSG